MRRLETERLILRDWKEADLSDLFLCLSNPNVTIPEGSIPLKALDECKTLLDYLIKVKNSYAIVLKSTGVVIGGIGINADAKGNSNTRNLGYYLAEEFWNRGFMTEALKEVIANAKEVTEILSASHNNNPKSEYILKKLGFKQVDSIRHVKRKIEQAAHDDDLASLR